MRTKINFGVVFISIILFSCGNNKDNKTSEFAANQPADSTGQEATYKIYSLPAPMQLPSALKMNTQNFSEEFLSTTDQKKQPEGTNIKKSEMMGIYGVDLGYCLLFDQNQSSINYLS